MMDFGIDTLVYIIIGVIFVLAQAARKRNIAKGKPQAAAHLVKEEAKKELSAFWKEFLGIDPIANQVPEPVRIHPVPPDFVEPEDFHRTEPAFEEPVLPKSSLNDPGDRADAGCKQPAKLSDGDQPCSTFDLRSAVVYTMILERKYV